MPNAKRLNPRGIFVCVAYIAPHYLKGEWEEQLDFLANCYSSIVNVFQCNYLGGAGWDGAGKGGISAFFSSSLLVSLTYFPFSFDTYLHTHSNERRNSTHHTVAAASSSPHRSTISAATSRRITHRNNNMMNPEDDDGIWQDNEESTSRYNIFLGKSDSRTHSSSRRYKSSRDNASSMLSSSSSVAAPAPLLNGPIPGSIDDPATVSSRSNNEQVYYNNVDNDKNAVEEDDEEENAILSRFIHLLRTQHKPPLECVEMDGDGNCLFRAISLQVYGDATMHLEVRRQCLDFMEREEDHFRSFVADEEFDDYIARKRLDGVHGVSR